MRIFDIRVLGEGHIPVFKGVKFDQTGLLSTLLSIGNILIGFLSGRLIDLSENKMHDFKKLILWGLAGIALSMTTFCWFVGWILFRRRIFIKI